MSWILILLILSAIFCFSYTTFMKIKFNVASISESYYMTGKKRYFLLWILGIVSSLIPCWLEVTPDSFQFIPFISACCLCCVGIAADYKDLDSFWHPFFTSCCGLFSLIWCGLIGLWYIPLILILPVFGIICYKTKLNLMSMWKINGLFWLEISAFLSIYISIFSKLL